MSDKKTVLVVDDQNDLVEPLSIALENEGFNVLTAGNGKEGLKVALAEKPDLILLDLLMPLVNGQEVLKELKHDEWGKQAKVIVMTVLDDLENIAEAVEHGGSEYIVKTDVTLTEIVNKIKKTLGD